ncbi:hypothetical protein AB5J56_00475 [Streptomyces sp. R21]|uniref:Uncharacterized protein n=1 Tax=Streptomyces sp. R21 TaxID=3238627 RepID=A0AB39NY89_9ACTN
MDRGDVDGDLVAAGVLFIPGRDSPLLLEAADSALDRMAGPIVLKRRPAVATGAATALAVADLVDRLGNGVADPAFAQVTASGIETLSVGRHATFPTRFIDQGSSRSPAAGIRYLLGNERASDALLDLTERLRRWR